MIKETCYQDVLNVVRNTATEENSKVKIVEKAKKPEKAEEFGESYY